MIKFAKVINEETKECEVGLGTNTEFYKSLGMTEQDVEQAYNGAWYLKGYAPAKPEPTVEEKIKKLENEIEILNSQMVRDLIILQNPISQETEKEEAQSYFNKKFLKKQELINKINELKNK